MASFSGFVRGLLLAGVLSSSSVLSHGQEADPGQTASMVARWLEDGHYSREKLDPALSAKFLQMYLTTLDYNKLYFTQKDVDGFQAKYGATLGDSVLKGDVTPAREIFAVFKQRVDDRIASSKKVATEDFKFDTNESVEVNRKDAPWPADQAAADTIWRERIEAELLKEKLAELKLHSPQETVTRRYDQVLRNVDGMDDGDVVKTFLNALALTYDPHSEYMSPSDLKNFEIMMKLSLVGVGAVLTSEDGYATIKELVPGGPADKEGHLKVNDRIAAVAQGKDEFEDVVDMKLDKVVEKIRGEAGSTVRLMVIPGDATDPSKRKVVEIVRDEVKLQDQEAKAEVLDLKGADGHTMRVGWITLPLFYSNMDESGTPKSTTADIKALLTRLKSENIQGLVMDLRRDGGGSLEEAINLTGLFIPHGPVVQTKDSNGKIFVSEDTDPGVAYNGPMMVLVNRMSASASEIFAAALQDYNRAVIVGDERSFGKGTVQKVVEIGRPVSLFSMGASGAEANAGAIKLTIQKFYRVKGGSTQLKGVESDIVLPSLTDNAEIGEGSLTNRLEYDEVAPAKIDESLAVVPLVTNELKARSAARVAADPEFKYIEDDVARLKEKLAENTLSLNEKARRDEMEADKLRKETRDRERLARGPALDAKDYEVTLKDLDSPALRPVAFDRDAAKSLLTSGEDDTDAKTEKKKPLPDPIRNEALRIMGDYIDLSKQTKTASILPEKAVQ